MKPLAGFTVLDFSQYLAGPSAALRLSDLGARVIKIERPDGGDRSRNMTLKSLRSQGDSVLFQTINRGKQSFCANLKDPAELAQVKQLIAQADAMIENFRPGVMAKLGLDYPAVKALNPGIVYGTVTGYGSGGPWVKRPGQDLLIQSISGATWLNGDADALPTPFPLSLADSYAGVHLAEGILACLFRRQRTGLGGLVEVSLLASMIDMQFEVLTTYLNDGRQPMQRGGQHSASAYLGAPYGIYETTDGYLALSMGSLNKLGEILDLPQLADYSTAETFSRREEIRAILAGRFRSQTTAHWLNLLEAAGYWCAAVGDWQQLTASAGFQALDMLLDVGRAGSNGLTTTRCPISIDGEPYHDNTAAPLLGEHTRVILRELAAAAPEDSL